MRLLCYVIAILCCGTIRAAALPSGEDVKHARKPTHHTPDEEHIVILASGSRNTTRIMSHVKLQAAHPSVRYVFNNSAFAGFVATMPSASISHLTQMEDVLHIEKTAAASIPVAANTVTSPGTWGLQRISSADSLSNWSSPLNYTYTYDASSSSGPGANVDIYVVDSGILASHEAFQGHARFGWSYSDITTDDCGHGTHVSASAAGLWLGPAPAANVIAVKVLDANGTGTTARVVAGIDYIVRMHDAKRAAGSGNFTGSIMSMSLGTPLSDSLNTIVGRAIANGVHAVVAAGNDGGDACQHSPSALGGANSSVVTVGSVGFAGAVSSFSNIGACVDVYAPGEDVLSAWPASDSSTKMMSGTSMATPHVAGVMAYWMAKNQTLASDPALLKQAVLGMAVEAGGVYVLNNGQYK